MNPAALASCFAAIEEGVDRVHGTALGIGERVGNAEMDLLLINLELLSAHWLEEHGFDPNDEALCQRIFDDAKRTSSTLRDEEIRLLVREQETQGA